MATIIKCKRDGDPTPPTSVRTVAFSLDEFSQNAEHYLTDVHREAARIVQQANSDGEEIRHQAEQAGRLAAEQAAHRALDEKVSHQMAALESAVAQLVDARGAWLDHWQRCAIQLAAAMAERIVRRELQQRPEITLDWIREALELTAGASEVVLQLHPTDLEGLGNQVDQIVRTLSSLAPAQIQSDENIARGGCVVRTKFGAIDQQIKTQLDRLVVELT